MDSESSYITIIKMCETLSKLICLVYFCFYCFCFCFCFFQDRVSLCSSGCTGTHSVDQAGLKLRNPPASASQVLGLKACAISTQPVSPLMFKYLINFSLLLVSQIRSLIYSSACGKLWHE